MTTSDPTTGEIVEEARRVMSGAWACAGCDLRTVLRQAADRLESQEREIERLRGQIDLQGRICKVCDQKLIARAEQAEQREIKITRFLIEKVIPHYQEVTEKYIEELLKPAIENLKSVLQPHDGERL